MLTNIITIGNSRGVRIPKFLLEESGLFDEVELKVRKGEIRILPVKRKSKSAKDIIFLSEKSLSDWNKKEEDVAWEELQ